MKLIKQNVELIWINPNPEVIIESIGRTCYKSENKITSNSSGKFCKMLVKSGHEAMIEHSFASFRIVTNRAIQNEIVRHRLASFAVESTRWIDYTNKGELTFIETDNDEILKFYRESEKLYFELVNQGMKPQFARDILPLGLKSELVMTANFREWRHFIKLRSSNQAHPQIQEIAKRILEILVMYAPNVFEDLTQ